MKPARRRPVPFVDPVHRVILTTNAKCAGTAVKHWFFNEIVLSPGWYDQVRRYVRLPPRYMLYLRKRRKRFAGSPDDAEVRRLAKWYRNLVSEPRLGRRRVRDRYHSIAVVRHPNSRIVSAYLEKFCGEDRDRSWVRAVGEHLGTTDVSFSGLLDYLEETADEQQNYHWRRQSYILETVPPPQFVRIEFFKDDVALLPVARYRQMSLARTANATRHLASDHAPVDLSDDPVHLSASALMRFRERSGAFPPKSAFLTDETRTRIAKIYRRDFAMMPFYEPW